MAIDPEDLLARLARSKFRARFHLDEQSAAYLSLHGIDAVMQHGAGFIMERVAPACPGRDGKQTPMRGHPVFIAQHATGSCCRGCLAKWHGLPKDVELTKEEQAKVLMVIRLWIVREATARNIPFNPAQGSLF